MEKKYQVFVSSTFNDLEEERKQIIISLLDLNCIPVGMEQFPASSLSQWEYIEKMMNLTDYYLLISAGKYGSIDPETGLSFTEKEYDYAKEKGIPILAFIIEDMGSLPGAKLWKNDEERAHVEQFQDKVKNGGQLVDFYSSVDDLKYKVAKAIPQIIKDKPTAGWIRGDSPSEQREDALHREIYPNISRLGKVLQEEFAKPVEEYCSSVLGLGLSTEAQELLLEASKDIRGEIIWLNHLGGSTIQTNKKAWDLSNPRTKAKYTEIINVLEENGYIEAAGYKREIFKLTSKGYEIGDLIKTQLKDDGITR